MFTLLGYYFSHQSKRTLIFNFNINEQFDLLSDSFFLNDEWSKLVDNSTNLEDIETESKTGMFRTSYIDTVRQSRNTVKVILISNCIFKEGLNKEILSNKTDYKLSLCYD